jgi:aspartyl-tRNA(Asn)/glutamyl-tRNA(Gln) amidotransferase subunit C
MSLPQNRSAVWRDMLSTVANGGHGDYSEWEISHRSKTMSVDLATVKRVARLARIAVSEEEAQNMLGQLNGILGFVEQLSEVNVDGVEPMTSVTPVEMKKRADVVTDGNKAEDIVANAPATDRDFFMVPKVVE